MGESRLSFPVGLEGCGDKGDVDQSIPLEIEMMSIAGMDPVEQVDIHVFVRMVPRERERSGCRSEDLELRRGEEFKELMLGLGGTGLGNQSGWGRGSCGHGDGMEGCVGGRHVGYVIDRWSAPSPYSSWIATG